MRSLQRWLSKIPLRQRLTGWYVLLLGLTLLLFSSYLYFQLERSLLAQLDAALEVAASQAVDRVSQRNNRPAFKTTEDSLGLTRRLSQTGFAVRLIAPDGTVWDGFGSYREVPIWIPRTSGYVSLEENEIIWRIYSQRIQIPNSQTMVWLQSAQPLAATHEASESLYSQIFFSLPLVLLLAGLGGRFLANRALRPIDNITRTAQAIGAGDLTQRIQYQGAADEVGRLATTFDHMLDRIQATFARERRFTADASHELRTPLTIIRGRINLALSHPRTCAEYKSTLQDLEQEVNRLIRLSSDLLFLARLDQRRLPWRPETVNLSKLLEAVFEHARSLTEAKNITLVEEVSPDLKVYGEADYLISLFLNLIDNAIKYTPIGGRVTVTAERNGAEVCIAVSDTGPGIPSEHLPHLFERFYRVEEDRSRGTGGTGLGLAIADEIVRLHGGQMEVKSEVNRGTTFIVCLPVMPHGSTKL